jgi:patatin-like phospholipase/acyl hydrolase
MGSQHAIPPRKGSKNTQMFRVLAIDGGGIRGIIPATVLTSLEHGTGRRIWELFDLIVGTSTGGILALALTCPRDGAGPRKAADIASLYLDRGETIFPLGGYPTIGVAPKGKRLTGITPPLPPGASRLDRIKNFLGYQNIAKTFAPFGGHGKQGNSRYPSGPLEKELREQLGDARMSSAVCPVIVVSCDFATGRPLVFRGGGLPQAPLGDATMVEAARATSAGPTFFPPLVHQGFTCVDGGLVANDPAFVAYTEATELQRQAGRKEDMLLVSLGTGMKEPNRPSELDDVPQLVDHRVWPQLLPAVTQAMSNGAGEALRQGLTKILGERYVRIQTVILPEANHAMDDVRPANVDALKRTGSELVRKSADALKRLASLL